MHCGPNRLHHPNLHLSHSAGGDKRILLVLLKFSPCVSGLLGRFLFYSFLLEKKIMSLYYHNDESLIYLSQLENPISSLKKIRK
jgi:hypothetical protein